MSSAIPTSLVCRFNDTITTVDAAVDWRSVKLGEHKLFVLGRIDSCPSVATPHDLNAVLKHIITQQNFADIIGQFTALYAHADNIIIYRSQFSPWQLYYSDCGIASTLLSLASLLPASPRFSEAYFLRFIAQMRSLQFAATLTPIENIHRLGAAEEIAFVGNKIQRKQARNRHIYKVVENLQQTPQDVSGKIAELLKNIVADYVQEHSDRRLFSELSGGLDSSHITSIAAASGAKPKCYMYTFAEHASHTFSEQCAEKVAEHYHLELHKAMMPDFVMPNFAEPLAIGSEPADLMWQGALFSSFVRRLTGRDAVILSGFGADQLFIRQNDMIMMLIKAGRFRLAFRAIADLARDLNRSTAHFVWQAVLASLPRKLYLRLSRPFRNAFFNPFKVEEVDSSLYFYERIKWLKTGKQHYEDWLFNIQSEGIALDQQFFAADHVHPDQSYFTAPERVTGPFYQPDNIAYVHPFCDSRLLDFVYRNVSWHLIHDWHNPYKHLLREAQKGVLHEFVRNRKNNEFSTDGFFHHVLTSNKNALRAALLSISDEFPQSIDKDAVMQDFDRLMFGVADLSVQRLLRLSSYALWMQNFKAQLQNQSKP